jgi:hypothetical protein
MAVLFDTVPGRIKTIPVSGDVRSFSISYKGQLLIGILTGMSLQEEVTAQIATALDGSVHVTPFGDKPSAMTVTVVLNQQCDETEADDPLSQYMDLYKTQRLHPDNNLTPEIITTGDTSYLAYVIGQSYQATASGQSSIVGSLRFVGWRV